MIRLRLMTGDDVPAGLALSRQAGWNQTEADWRRALALQPDGCFVASVLVDGLRLILGNFRTVDAAAETARRARALLAKREGVLS